MDIIKIIGYKRKTLGKKESKILRNKGYVPSTIYGEKKQIFFYSQIFSFKNIIYTNRSYFIDINIEDLNYKCILQDIQFHPVSEMILHIDFLEINESKKIKIKIPINLFGESIGLKKGGKIINKIKNIKILSYPKYIPNYINIDISNLDLGNVIKIKDISSKNYKILDDKNFPIVLVKSIKKDISKTNKEEKNKKDDDLKDSKKDK